MQVTTAIIVVCVACAIAALLAVEVFRAIDLSPDDIVMSLIPLFTALFLCVMALLAVSL